MPAIRPSVISLFFFGSQFLACTPHQDPGAAESVFADEPGHGKVRIVMTVDWEGNVLDPANIQAMRSFAADYPSLPVLHYLNAAYYTKDGADASVVSQTIASALKPGDQRGLHIHGWKSLFLAAKVPFRSGPAWWNRPERPEDCSKECGAAIPISHYDAGELAKVIHFSTSTLNSHGFGKAVHFRAGGWMLNGNVSEALAAEGFATDSSAVPTDFLAPKLQKYPMHTTLAKWWHDITPLSQPYQLQTPKGALWEVPDNGCLADYMSPDSMTEVVEKNLKAAKADGKVRYVVVGFHQETAVKYSAVVRGFLEKMKQLHPDSKEVEFVSMPNQF